MAGEGARSDRLVAVRGAEETSLAVETATDGSRTVDVKMTLTAPGCGMGPVIAEDARQKILRLPTVAEARVHIVWDPQWTPQMISETGRKALGLD